MRKGANGLRPVHFVGSIPLDSVEAVFAQIGTLLGPHLRRIPDGELGARLGWVRCQIGVFEASPLLQRSAGDTDWRRADTKPEWSKFRLKLDESASDITFGPLGYGQWAIESYANFVAARSSGILPKDCRFQVCLPTPYGVTNILADHSAHVAIASAYDRALQDEIARMVAAIPAGDLAIQWDVAQEIECIASGASVFFPLTKDEAAESLSRLASYVPAGAEVGFHFCYGDYEHKHFIDPVDMGDMVDVLNGIWAHSERPIDFVHMPVPLDRSDDEYFAPLARLQRHPETELYLGLIHFTDGLGGTLKRLKTAQRHLSNFGIGTECGFGRRPPATIPALLKIHADAAVVTDLEVPA